MARGIPAPIGTMTIVRTKSNKVYVNCKTPQGWKPLHHIIAESPLVLNRPLKQDEQVFFKDGDQTNIAPENIGIREVRNALVVDGAKLCPRCGQVKPVGQFYLQKSGKLKSHCKSCNNRWAKRGNIV